MNKLTKIMLALALLVTCVIPTTVTTYARDPICPNVTKTEKCPYCSTYAPCCDAWSKCRNPERVLGIHKWSRTKDIAELPMCTVLHKKETDYKKISIVNDSNEKVIVKMHYSLTPLIGLDHHTKRELAPGDTYDFKYDKHAGLLSKYVEMNGYKQKVNHGQIIKVTEVS